MKVATFGAKRALAFASLLSLTALLLAAGGSARPHRRPQHRRPGWAGMDSARVCATERRPSSSSFPTIPSPWFRAKRDVKLSKSEKEAIKSQLKAKQDGVRGGIANLGGTVLAEYQVAYNGIKVRIDRSKLDELAQLSGVTGVHALQLMTPDNVRGVPLIGAPAVWDGLAGLHGEGIKVAVIDTGIDYTHANFGGPGTVAAYNAANAADTLPARPAAVRSSAPRVKGGTDLVGDDYNAAATAGSPALIPHPDPNPLDCNGHGSHVAGTAGGSGVLANGSTYTGTYNATHDLGQHVDDRPGRRAEGGPLLASASSVAWARPTSLSTRSSGQSTTTWTSSTCRSARRSARRTIRPRWLRRTRPRPA